MIPLANSHFSVTASNFALVLNRRAVAKKLTLKMVKDLKKKERCENSSKQKNDDEDASTWTCEYCKKNFKSHDAVQEGNQAKLQSRCVFLKKLISCGFENLMSMSKTDLRQMSANLTLPFGADVSKDDLIANISNVMINNHNDTIEDALALVEKEDGFEDLI